MKHISLMGSGITISSIILVVLSGCAPMPLKTVELQPLMTTTGTTIDSGSFGFCSAQGKTPLTTFSAEEGTIMVGYDDYLKGGKAPFACDDVHVSVFRGGVKFDVSQFDSIVNAEFQLNTTKSISRSNGKIVDTAVPISYANKLCMATEIYSSRMLCDYATLLPVGETITLGVTEEVRDWVNMRRNNFGFVLNGPRVAFSPQAPPKDNDAKISWYSNFRLRITYAPALNSRVQQ